MLNGFCHRLLALVLHLCGRYFKLKKATKTYLKYWTMRLFFFYLFLNFVFYLKYNLLMKSVSPSTCVKKIQINQITSLSILECGLMWRRFEKWFSQQDTNQMIWMFVHHNRTVVQIPPGKMYIFSLRASVKSKRDRNVFCLVSRKYGNT